MAKAQDAGRATFEKRGASTVGSTSSCRATAVRTLRVTAVSPRSASPIVW